MSSFGTSFVVYDNGVSVAKAPVCTSMYRSGLKLAPILASNFDSTCDIDLSPRQSTAPGMLSPSAK